MASGDIEDTPYFGVDVDTEYLLGVGKIGGRVRLLLDIITASDIIHLKKAASGENKEIVAESKGAETKINNGANNNKEKQHA